MEILEKIEAFLDIVDSNGYGFGYGDGNGIKSINGKCVYRIDGVPTVIESLHGNYAKGYTLRYNVELVPCYIAKCGNYFAHAETLAMVQKEARKKYEERKPLEERIEDFIKQYPTLEIRAQASDLFD